MSYKLCILVAFVVIGVCSANLIKEARQFRPPGGPGGPGGPRPGGRPGGRPPLGGRPGPGGHHHGPGGPHGGRPGHGHGGPPRPPPNRCNNTDGERNKQMIATFYQGVFGDRNYDLIDQYLAVDIINHNPMERDGIDGLREVLPLLLGDGPPTTVEIYRMVADGDLVWTHSKVPAPGVPATFAAMDIFRINCEGKIAEHWDVLQDINVPSQNDHPFF